MIRQVLTFRLGRLTLVCGFTHPSNPKFLADNFNDWPKNVKGKSNFHKASAKKKKKKKNSSKINIKTAAKTAKAVAKKCEHCSKRNMSTPSKIMKV